MNITTRRTRPCSQTTTAMTSPNTMQMKIRTQTHFTVAINCKMFNLICKLNPNKMTVDIRTWVLHSMQ